MDVLGEDVNRLGELGKRKAGPDVMDQVCQDAVGQGTDRLFSGPT